MIQVPPDSFTFGTTNSLTEWGIKVIAYDLFSAPKRERKQKIPFRSGSYDYGEKWYDEKLITLDCCTETKQLSKADMREVIYHMSQRSKLVLWDEPDKYYMAELFDSAEIHVEPKYVKQQFTLTLVCEPFAFRDQVVIPMAKGINKVLYTGTAETPTLIIIKNPNNFSVNTIRVTAVERKKA